MVEHKPTKPAHDRQNKGGNSNIKGKDRKNRRHGDQRCSTKRIMHFKPALLLSLLRNHSAPVPVDWLTLRKRQIALLTRVPQRKDADMVNAGGGKPRGRVLTCRNAASEHSVEMADQFAGG